MIRVFPLAVSLLGGGALAQPTLSVPAGAPFIVARGVDPSELEGPRRTPAMQKLAQAIYREFRDEADFMVVSANRRSVPESTPVKGYHLRVKNDVKGIGVPTFNAGKNFGGTRRLQGLLYFPNTFPFWKIPFIHEFAHGWGNDLLPTAEPGHFGFCGAGSQLGGFDSRTLRKIGPELYQARNLRGASFGTAANGGNSVPYSDFELYLMGLLPAQAVKPFQCAYAGAWVNRSAGIFQANRLHSLNIQAVQSKYGPRQPDFAHSPKTFRLLAVLVSSAPPTRQELSTFSLTLQHLTGTGDDGDSNYTFNEATRGLGRLHLLDPRTLRR
ncbi:hypothetical protein [Deinococcus fonticola]|uniref:hypothetical protein n=1 Tax=Deinococcus fonticola TaxID=2528713 RepID=UPI001075642F|nr:hypothetical protein [Deinococcus fonticola]